MKKTRDVIQISWRTKIISLFILILSASLLIQVFYIIPFIQNREVKNAEIRQTEIARNIGREMDIGLANLTRQNGRAVRLLVNLQLLI